jgi:hypothetical protein
MVNLWQTVWFWLKGTVSEKQAEQLAQFGKEALQKTQSGLELRYLDSREADCALKLSTAAAQLIGSLRGEQEAVLRLGPLLLVKVTLDGKSQIIAESVCTDIRRILDNNPRLLNSPSDLFKALQEMRDGERANKLAEHPAGGHPRLEI